jgi:hypothetical protein
MPQRFASSGIPTRTVQRLLGAIGMAALPLLGGYALANTTAVPAVYATRAEAEEAARKHFNCTGAHPMGKQWMPCAIHGQASGSAHNHP